MITKFREFLLNENSSFDFWYPMFQGRYYRSMDNALSDIRGAVAHRQKQQLIGSKPYDTDQIISMFDIVENDARKKDRFYIKPATGFKKAKIAKKVYTYETSLALRSKQIRVWEDVYEQEFGRYYGPLEWLRVNDKRIYATESTDDSTVNTIKNLIKEGEELPPIMLNYDYGILDGHHRWEAAKLLRIKEIPVFIYFKDDESDE